MSMEPIPYFYETIDRNAILVRPKKPFFNWLKSVFPEDNDELNVKEESNIYLIRESDRNDSIKRWIKSNYDNLFVNELNDWVTDENVWPQNRTYQLFQEWFDIEIHSMILDLEDFPVTKD